MTVLGRPPFVADQVDHLIGGGLVDKEQLRVILAPAARKAKVAELHEQGLSQRQIAAVVGVDHATVSRDLSGAGTPEGGAHGSRGLIGTKRRALPKLTA